MRLCLLFPLCMCAFFDEQKAKKQNTHKKEVLPFCICVDILFPLGSPVFIFSACVCKTYV
eukprot:m.274894 g.274894  ORF g.274894 m.274894 type:complete len:60 (-) comp102654_c0_seq1:133-312(-)